MAEDKHIEITEKCLDESIDAFFKSAPPLQDLDNITKKLENFVAQHSVHSGTYFFFLKTSFC
jgi:hypothetical protein